MVNPIEMYSQGQHILDRLREQGMKLVTAESCTGGLIGAYLTEYPGSSLVFERGFVTYSNESKTEMLGVERELIQQYGAVSQEVAEAMAVGAIRQSKAHVAISVTGIAGPEGGTEEKPVGTVWFGLATQGGVRSESHHFKGNRGAVRLSAVQHALRMLSVF